MGNSKVENTLKKGADKIESGAKQLGIKTSHYIISAMGIVVGLSWNDTIKDTIREYFPLGRDEIRAKILYSVILTGILLLLVSLLPNTKSELPAETKIKVERQELESTKKELKRSINENKKILDKNEKMLNKIKKYYDPNPYTTILN